jgi:hypothetical protein
VGGSPGRQRWGAAGVQGGRQRQPRGVGRLLRGCRRAAEAHPYKALGGRQQPHRLAGRRLSLALQPSPPPRRLLLLLLRLLRSVPHRLLPLCRRLPVVLPPQLGQGRDCRLVVMHRCLHLPLAHIGMLQQRGKEEGGAALPRVWHTSRRGSHGAELTSTHTRQCGTATAAADTASKLCLDLQEQLQRMEGTDEEGLRSPAARHGRHRQRKRRGLRTGPSPTAHHNRKRRCSIKCSQQVDQCSLQGCIMWLATADVDSGALVSAGISGGASRASCWASLRRFTRQLVLH